MNLGYVRVSTEEQDIKNQELEIRRYADNKDLDINKFIQLEISSRKNEKDRKINELKSTLSEKDNLIVSELSRLGRSTKEVLFLLDELKEKGVIVHLIKQNMIIDKNSNDPMSKLLITLLASFGELERDLISQRTKEALKSKKESGVILGRPLGSTGKSKLDGKEEQIKELLEKGLTKTAVSKLFGCDRSTLNNFIRKRSL
eukprot:Anaeramoba_ignava/a484839_10.p1 GENE.a484839_10~~a484839_10.p1  ORF type:complete len:201 (-),score=34.23 a484839_10:135-737(-)